MARIGIRAVPTRNRRRIARCRSGPTQVDFANHMPYSARDTGKGAALSWSCTLTARAAFGHHPLPKNKPMAVPPAERGQSSA